jgi:hypothetical protein
VSGEAANSSRPKKGPIIEPAPLGSINELVLPLRQYWPVFGFQYVRKWLPKDQGMLEAAEQPALPQCGSFTLFTRLMTFFVPT